jgi:hypothetical protein
MAIDEVRQFDLFGKTDEPEKMPETSAAALNVYYVYILFDWLGIPKYVGYGHDERWLDHEKGKDRPQFRKDNFIEQTWIMLGEIPKIKVRENISKAAAIETEIALIAAIGRMINGTGPLTNITPGGDGIDSEIAKKINAERWANPTTEQRNRQSEIGRAGALKQWADIPLEERSAIMTARWAAMPEGRMSEGAFKREAARTPEERSAVRKKAYASRSEEWKAEFSRKGIEARTQTHDQLSEYGYKSWTSKTPGQKIAHIASMRAGMKFTFSLDQIITIIDDSTKKRHGPNPSKRRSLYVNGMTVAEALEKGITRRHLLRDTRAKFIRIE